MTQSRKPIGVGIRGAGQVAVEHARAINANPHLFVAAVCSRREESARALARNHAAGAAVLGSYEELLEHPEVGVVSICMPNHLHAVDAVAALDAGKHLILEKPPAITYEELSGLRDAARRSTQKTVVSFVLRWHPMVQRIKQLVGSGAVGDIYFSQADYWHGIKKSFASYEWIRQQQFAGGAMITGGCHAADIVRYLTGKEVTEVFAYSTPGRADFDYPTTVVAATRMNDGSVGRLSASLDGLAFPYQFNIDLLGSDGAIRDNRVCSPGDDVESMQFDELDVASPNSGTVAHHPFQQEIDSLAEAILNDGSSDCEVLDACNSIEISLAIQQSARTGKPVDVRSGR